MIAANSIEEAQKLARENDELDELDTTLHESEPSEDIEHDWNHWTLVRTLNTDIEKPEVILSNYNWA